MEVEDECHETMSCVCDRTIVLTNSMHKSCTRSSQSPFPHRWREGSQHPPPTLKTYWQLTAANMKSSPFSKKWVLVKLPIFQWVANPTLMYIWVAFFFNSVCYPSKNKEKELEQEKKTQS